MVIFHGYVSHNQMVNIINHQLVSKIGPWWRPEDQRTQIGNIMGRKWEANRDVTKSHYFTKMGFQQSWDVMRIFWELETFTKWMGLFWQWMMETQSRRCGYVGTWPTRKRDNKTNKPPISGEHGHFVGWGSGGWWDDRERGIRNWGYATLSWPNAVTSTRRWPGFSRPPGVETMTSLCVCQCSIPGIPQTSHLNGKMDTRIFSSHLRNQGFTKRKISVPRGSSTATVTTATTTSATTTTATTTTISTSTPFTTTTLTTSTETATTVTVTTQTVTFSWHLGWRRVLFGFLWENVDRMKSVLTCFETRRIKELDSGNLT